VYKGAVKRHLLMNLLHAVRLKLVKVIGVFWLVDACCCRQRTPRVDFSDNPMYEPSFRFYDNRLWEAVKAGNPHVHMFFRLLALCHTVMPEDKDGTLYRVAWKTPHAVWYKPVAL